MVKCSKETFRYIIYIISKDVDEDEVDEFIHGNCHLLAKVNLVVPIVNQNITNKTNINTPQVASVSLQHFHRNQFKYDATWFTKRFHNLGALWIKQNSIVQDKISSIIKNAFSKELIDFDVDTWISRKVLSLQEKINSAKSHFNMVESVNKSSNSTLNENIDPGLLI